MLSLFEMEVNISLLTNGGQSVTQYTVSWLTVCVFIQISSRCVQGCRDAHVRVVSLSYGPWCMSTGELQRDAHNPSDLTGPLLCQCSAVSMLDSFPNCSTVYFSILYTF